MEYKVLNDFKSVQQVSKEEIQAYQDKLPEELLHVWGSLGFGTFMNGYLKVIDPKGYQGTLNASYFHGSMSIPIMVTGFGDIITWEDNKYIGLVKYRKGTFNIIASGCKYFFDNLLDDYYLNEHFNVQQYEEAYMKYGELKYNECFGYVPLLGLGGSENIDHLDKVKVIEHIAIITHFMGKIE